MPDNACLDALPMRGNTLISAPSHPRKPNGFNDPFLDARARHNGANVAQVIEFKRLCQV
jgi:hypothetical protein